METILEVQILELLEKVRLRQLGFGKAAELAGMSVGEFLTLMGQHQVSPFDYNEEELSRELRAGESEGSGALASTERPSSD